MVDELIWCVQHATEQGRNLARHDGTMTLCDNGWLELLLHDASIRNKRLAVGHEDKVPSPVHATGTELDVGGEGQTRKK